MTIRLLMKSTSRNVKSSSLICFPYPQGLSDTLRNVQKLVRGLRAIVSLINPKTWGPFLHAWERTHFDHDFTVSYSQFGEDLALINLIGDRTGRYLDIGAHHPSRFSNTRLLYERGWSGVNVEANPELISAFEKARARDTTFPLALDYFRITHLQSLKSLQFLHLIKSGKVNFYHQEMPFKRRLMLRA